MFFSNTQWTVQFCTGVPQIASKFQIPILTLTQQRIASECLKSWLYALVTEMPSLHRHWGQEVEMWSLSLFHSFPNSFLHKFLKIIIFNFSLAQKAISKNSTSHKCLTLSPVSVRQLRSRKAVPVLNHWNNLQLQRLVFLWKMCSNVTTTPQLVPVAY